MVRSEDIAIIIRKIKEEMRAANEKVKENEKKSSIFSQFVGGVYEGKVIGLHRACEIIRDELKEYFPELLENETCEIE